MISCWLPGGPSTRREVRAFAGRWVMSSHQAAQVPAAEVDPGTWLMYPPHPPPFIARNPFESIENEVTSSRKYLKGKGIANVPALSSSVQFPHAPHSAPVGDRPTQVTISPGLPVIEA